VPTPAPRQELFDIVNEADLVIGTASRAEVHGNPDLMHRVVHVLIFNSGGLLYLQKRADSKDVQPGKWDTSVGGHVDYGEDYPEAAIREMGEELSISGITPRSLYKYRHRNDYESEMVTTYLVRWDGAISVQPEEISEGRFWDLDEIDAADPGIFTPNFLEELERYRRRVGRAISESG
jgi:isopentenyldiphosphate isomerase